MKTHIRVYPVLFFFYVLIAFTTVVYQSCYEYVKNGVKGLERLVLSSVLTIPIYGKNIFMTKMLFFEELKILILSFHEVLKTEDIKCIIES